MASILSRPQCVKSTKLVDLHPYLFIPSKILLNNSLNSEDALWHHKIWSTNWQQAITRTNYAKLIVNWTFGNKLNSEFDLKIFYQEISFENAGLKMSFSFRPQCVNSLSPKQNGHHFADNAFKCIFLNENFSISTNISLKCVP